jgi:hypothetical protein
MFKSKTISLKNVSKYFKIYKILSFAESAQTKGDLVNEKEGRLLLIRGWGGGVAYKTFLLSWNKLLCLSISEAFAK